jgi:IclR family transcriptional regulator, KDG regulon repressor
MDAVQSLARGLMALDLIINSERSLGVTELAQELGVDKSSASRLMKTLAQHGYVQLEPGTRRYTPGKRLYHISLKMLSLMPLRQYARPYLYRLMQETGECAHTAVYAEGKALVIDDVETETTLRVVSGTGRMIPLHCTALGKVMLAFGGVPMPETLPPFTACTLTEVDALSAHLEQVRAQGYALDDEEYDAGIRCLAAPVYNQMGVAIGAIGVSGPTVRVTRERLPLFAEAVIRAARELSAELGYSQDV